MTTAQAKRPPSNWLPMNSAPTDGSSVLVKYDPRANWDWAAKQQSMSRHPDIVLGHYDDSPDVYGDGYTIYRRPWPFSPWIKDDTDRLPIHRPLGWMPLPEL